LEKLVTGIDAFTTYLGKLLIWVCLGTMIATCVVVLMRYLFNAGNIIFVQESITYMHATVFLLASGWALQRNGHVRVDVFYRNFSPTTKAWVDSIGTLVFLLPLCVFLFLASLGFVELSWSTKESSADAGGIPLVYLLKTLIPVMCVVLGLQGVAELVRNGLFLCGLTETRDAESQQ